MTVVVFHPGVVQTDMGGAGAPLKTHESVGSLRNVIGRLTVADSGKFLNYNGTPLP